LILTPNPTRYDFDASISDIQSAVRKAFAEWRTEELKSRKSRVWKGSGSAEDKELLTMLLQLPPGSLLWKGRSDSLSKYILTQAGNENDFYFFNADSPVDASPVYFKDGQPLIYFADFHIHVSAISAERTRVQIFTHDSLLNTGMSGGWSPARGSTFLYVSVDPTTIEEYQILLRIGKQMGLTNMPPLILPKPDAPTRSVIKSRPR
jgi:hypothetical protein